MKTKKLLSTAFSLSIGLALNAQVGIGNPTPDSTSVLDLTNPNNKGVVLPKAANQAAMSPSVNGMTYFYNNNIYYKTDSGYNAISPWKYKFNGNITHDIYYDWGGKIGIGNTNLSQSPEAPLQIETIDSVSLTDNGSLMIGKSTAPNIAINANEIQTRNTGSAAPLKINEDGGDVTFGSDATKVNVKASGRMQELHAPNNTYYDLLPAGTIVMWYGDISTIPTGWALCDGSVHTMSNGSGTITTPNLSGRFVVGYGNNGTTNYTAGQTGGQDRVTLTVSQMPSHNHGVSDPGHEHDYTFEEWYKSGHGDNATDKNFPDAFTNPTGTTTRAYTGISINYNGGGQSHENRPTFTALVYMMKL